MGLFSKKEKEIVYPFSGFEGQLLYKGKPAAGAKITRKYNQMDKDKFEETITADAEGRFKFESIAVEFTPPFIAAIEYISRQNIFVEYDGDNYHIWGAVKESKQEYGELGGSYRKLFCELTDEPQPKAFEGKGDTIITSCYLNQ